MENPNKVSNKDQLRKKIRGYSQLGPQQRRCCAACDNDSAASPILVLLVPTGHREVINSAGIGERLHSGLNEREEMRKQNIDHKIVRVIEDILTYRTSSCSKAKPYWKPY